MNIVIVGAKDRDSADDIADVEKLLELLEAKYPNCTLVTMRGHKGIGKVVKVLASKPKNGKPHRFPFCEADVHIYAKTLSRATVSQMYTARNAMLYEIGDVFYSFPHPQRGAMVDELIDKRVIPGGRPCKVFHVGDEISLV